MFKNPPLSAQWWSAATLAALLMLVGWRAPQPAAAQEAAEPPHDPVCAALLDDYILKIERIETANVEAAIQLIASRGLGNGYWRVVFDHFQRSPVNDSRPLLRILTKMLQRDGQARWLISRPEEMKHSAWLANVALPPAVLDAILARAAEADRTTLESYLIAVVAAHDIRSKAFLCEILVAPDNAEADDLFTPVTPDNTEAEGLDDLFGPLTPNNAEADDLSPVTPDNVEAGNLVASVPSGSDRVRATARFYAAVGLAELGDVAGIEWLVESDASGGFVFSRASHYAAPDNLFESRLLALADLTGEPFATLEEWRAWWAANEGRLSAFRPHRRVRLRYP